MPSSPGDPLVAGLECVYTRFADLEAIKHEDRVVVWEFDADNAVTIGPEHQPELFERLVRDSRAREELGRGTLELARPVDTNDDELELTLDPPAGADGDEECMVVLVDGQPLPTSMAARIVDGTELCLCTKGSQRPAATFRVRMDGGLVPSVPREAGRSGAGHVAAPKEEADEDSGDDDVIFAGDLDEDRPRGGGRGASEARGGGGGGPPDERDVDRTRFGQEAADYARAAAAALRELEGAGDADRTRFDRGDAGAAGGGEGGAADHSAAPPRAADRALLDHAAAPPHREDEAEVRSLAPSDPPASVQSAAGAAPPQGGRAPGPPRWAPRLKRDSRGHSAERAAANAAAATARREVLLCVSALGSDVGSWPVSPARYIELPAGEEATVTVGRSHQVGFYEGLLRSPEAKEFLHCVSRAHLEVSRAPGDNGKFLVVSTSGNPVKLNGVIFARGDRGFASLGDKIEFIAASRSPDSGEHVVYLVLRFERLADTGTARSTPPGGRAPEQQRSSGTVLQSAVAKFDPPERPQPPSQQHPGTILGLHEQRQRQQREPQRGPEVGTLVGLHEQRLRGQPHSEAQAGTAPGLHTQPPLPQQQQAGTILGLHNQPLPPQQQQAGTIYGLHDHPLPPHAAQPQSSSGAGSDRQRPGTRLEMFDGLGGAGRSPPGSEYGRPDAGAHLALPRTDAGAHPRTSQNLGPSASGAGTDAAFARPPPFHLRLSGSAVLPSLGRELRRLEGREDGLTVGRAHQRELHSAAFPAEVQQLISRDHFRIERHAASGICRLLTLSQNPMWLERAGLPDRQLLTPGQSLVLATGDTIWLFTGSQDGRSPDGHGSAGSLCWTFSGVSTPFSDPSRTRAEDGDNAPTQLFHQDQTARSETKSRSYCSPSEDGMGPKSSSSTTAGKDRTCQLPSFFRSSSKPSAAGGANGANPHQTV